MIKNKNNEYLNKNKFKYKKQNNNAEKLNNLFCKKYI